MGLDTVTFFSDLFFPFIRKFGAVLWFTVFASSLTNISRKERMRKTYSANDVIITFIENWKQ